MSFPDQTEHWCAGSRGFAVRLLLGEMLTAGGLLPIERPIPLLLEGEGQHRGIAVYPHRGTGAYDCDSACREEILLSGNLCDKQNSSFRDPVCGERAQ